MVSFHNVPAFSYLIIKRIYPQECIAFPQRSPVNGQKYDQQENQTSAERYILDQHHGLEILSFSGGRSPAMIMARATLII